MSRFGLIGFPIAHSLSPLLFKAAYGGRFRYDLLESEDFDTAFRAFMKSCDAVNVTAPFKELAFDKAKFRSPESELIGAANMLVKTPRGLSCFNSDCTAVRAMLEDFNNRAPENGKLRNVLVVGCGGAGKAAAVAAFTLGLEVTLMNRSIARALSFAQHLTAEAPKTAQNRPGALQGLRPGTVSTLPLDRFPSALLQHDAVIYTLPAAIDVPPFTSAIADSPEPPRLKLLFEANYRSPAFTPGILCSLPQTAEYIPGEQWLLQQALTGYGLMTGINPNRQALETALPRGTVIENISRFDKI